MGNSNYVTLARGFAAAAYFRGASAGAFNAVNADDSCFAAYCTFAINAGVQTPGTSAVAEYLWGNSEDASFSGWSLELVVVSNELVLQAKVGDGSAYTTVQEPITGAAVVATGQLPAAGIFNRLIMATMWLDGTNLVLAINGTICGFSPFDETTLTPSALSASLGAGGAAVAATPATYADIVSCGYSSDFPFAAVGPALAGTAFDAAQEGNGTGYVTGSGTDWTHRYAFEAAAAGRPGVINKTAAGAFPTGFPAAPSLADLGGQGRGNLGTYSPVALNRAGASTTLPILSQRKNMDWAHAGTFFFIPPVP